MSKIQQEFYFFLPKILLYNKNIPFIAEESLNPNYIEAGFAYFATAKVYIGLYDNYRTQEVFSYIEKLPTFTKMLGGYCSHGKNRYFNHEQIVFDYEN